MQLDITIINNNNEDEKLLYLHGANEKLAAVGIRTCISHAQYSRSNMLHYKKYTKISVTTIRHRNQEDNA